MDKETEDYVNRTSKMKSMVITITSRIEYQINLILASRFSTTGEEYEKFSRVFFNNVNELTFSVKIKMLENLLIEYYPEFLKQNIDFIKSLDRVRRLRNTFAHSIDPTLEELNDFTKKQSHMSIFFLEDGDQKNKVLSYDEIMLRIEDCKKINSLMFPIISHMHDQRKQEKIHAEK